MKTLGAIIIFLMELGILAGLIWKHIGLYEYTFTILLLLTSPGLVYLHRNALKKKNLSQMTRFALLFLTGPCVLLCVSLIVNLNRELKLGGTKDSIEMARREKVPNEFSNQWYKDTVKRKKSEMFIYVMLLASTLLLYERRYSSSRSPAMETTEAEKGRDNTS
jgi:hypothetical protein